MFHPKSFIHAIVHYKTGLTKMLAHDTTMEIPLINSMHTNTETFKFNDANFNYDKLNTRNFSKPNKSNYPLLEILKNEFKNTYFEIILVSLNDLLVKKYLENEIQYASIHILLLKLIKISFFKKYYNSKPKNIKDIKNMVNITNQYLKKYLIKHDYINKKY